jgi:hypothetical protein
MAMSIANLAKCKIHAEIRFLYAKGETAAEIHHQFVSVYVEDVMNRQNVAKWCCEFEVGRIGVHDEIRNERQSVVADEMIQKIDEKICADICLTSD